MGYKYGVWYVYPKGTFPTNHIGHFTVSCFMENEAKLRSESQPGTILC